VPFTFGDLRQSDGNPSDVVDRRHSLRLPLGGCPAKALVQNSRLS
jgi:hypothetical protein